jgi:ABC-type transporter Mla MlaB component
MEESQDANIIRLEGKLIGPWVQELERVWRSLGPSLQSKKLRLDLRAVAFIDDQGKQLLQEIYRKTNASFVADSPLTHYFAHAAMQQKSYREKHGG